MCFGQDICEEKRITCYSSAVFLKKSSQARICQRTWVCARWIEMIVFHGLELSSVIVGLQKSVGCWSHDRNGDFIWLLSEVWKRTKWNSLIFEHARGYNNWNLESRCETQVSLGFEKAMRLCPVQGGELVKFGFGILSGFWVAMQLRFYGAEMSFESRLSVNQIKWNVLLLSQCLVFTELFCKHYNVVRERRKIIQHSKRIIRFDIHKCS